MNQAYPAAVRYRAGADRWTAHPAYITPPTTGAYLRKLARRYAVGFAAGSGTSLLPSREA